VFKLLPQTVKLCLKHGCLDVIVSCICHLNQLVETSKAETLRKQVPTGEHT